VGRSLNFLSRRQEGRGCDCDARWDNGVDLWEGVRCDYATILRMGKRYMHECRHLVDKWE